MEILNQINILIKHIQSNNDNIDMLYDCHHGSENPHVRDLMYNNYIENKQYLEQLSNITHKLESYIENIMDICNEGLSPRCYKSYCSTCECYRNNKTKLVDLINKYIDVDGEFHDEDGDFMECMEAYIDNERASCNKAKPICEHILQILEQNIKEN